jgi:hypothetical protein
MGVRGQGAASTDNDILRQRADLGLARACSVVTAPLWPTCACHSAEKQVISHDE